MFDDVEDLLSFEVLRASGKNIRLHGNRFLQVDLTDDGSERVHVWHEGLLPLAQRTPAPIHDHVFSFRSTVLAGTLVNCEFKVDRAHFSGWRPKISDGRYYHVYAGVRRYEQDTQLVRADEGIYLAQSMGALVHVRHAEYAVPARAFHASVAVGYAITHFRREPGGEGQPYVLVPIGLTPDNEFNRYDLGSEPLWTIVRRIYRQLPECTV